MGTTKDNEDVASDRYWLDPDVLVQRWVKAGGQRMLRLPLVWFLCFMFMGLTIAFGAVVLQAIPLAFQRVGQLAGEQLQFQALFRHNRSARRNPT